MGARVCAFTEGRGSGAAVCKLSHWGSDLWSGYETMVGEGPRGSNQGVYDIKRRGGCRCLCVCVFVKGRGCAPDTELSPLGSVFDWGG